MKMKYLDCSEIDKSWLLKHQSVIQYIEEPFEGCVAYVHIEEVSYTIPVDYDDSGKVLIENGSKCLIIMPKVGYWCLSVFMDPKGNIIEYYFDMTKENIFEPKPCFVDLYLDIAISADGYTAVLDEDELMAAFQNQVISQEDVQQAKDTCTYLLEKVIPKKAFMIDFIKKQLKIFESSVIKQVIS